MKSICLILCVLVSTQLMADETLHACKADEIKELVYDQNKDMENFHMINSKGEIVGVYSHKDNDEVYAEVCEYIDAEMTVANEWYYWQEDHGVSSNPSKWARGDYYTIAQDEGIARLTVLDGSKKGEVTVKFEIEGWDGETEITHILKTDTLTFRKIK